MPEYTLSSLVPDNTLGIEVTPSEEVVSDSLVGVEVEAEGTYSGEMQDRQYCSELPRHWDFINDGSLRGLNFEAVLSHPSGGSELVEALYCLEELCEGRRINFSARTSLHVHVNALDMSISKIALMLGVYLVFEEAIFSYVGGSRNSNNYCMPLLGDRATAAALQCLSTNDKNLLYMVTDIRWPSAYLKIQGKIGAEYYLSKYSALNLTTLPKFGTLEFRHHEGTYHKSEILEWVNILLSLKEWTQNIPIELDQLAGYTSGIGVTGLAKEIFGRESVLLKHVNEEGGYRGMREVQSALINKRLPKKEWKEVPDSLGNRIKARNAI